MSRNHNQDTDTIEDDAVDLDTEKDPTDTQAKPGSDDTQPTDGHDESPRGEREETAIDADAELAALREELVEAPENAGTKPGKKDADEAPEDPPDKPKAEGDDTKPKPEDDAEDTADEDAEEAESQRWHPSARRSRRRLLKERARLREQLRERDENLTRADQAFGRLTEACKVAGLEPTELPNALRFYAEHKRSEANGGKPQANAGQPRAEDQRREDAPLDASLQLLVDTGELQEEDARVIMAHRQQQRQQAKPQEQRQQSQTQERETRDDGPDDRALNAAIEGVNKTAQELNAELEQVFGPQSEEAGARILAKAKARMRPDNLNAWPDILRIAAETEMEMAKSSRPRPTKTVPAARAASSNSEPEWKADLNDLRKQLVG